MTIRVYNTLKRGKETFIPIEPDKVTMYVCGPTVYDSCHVGHARSAIVFDVVARYFREKGFDVTYIRNFTDIDDKIINRANTLGVGTCEIADKYIQEYHKDMDSLKVKRATREPRATEYIEQIVGFIEKLFEKGLVYEADGDVYYAVEQFPDYGKLSGHRFEDLETDNQGGGDTLKRNPHDFALWKSAKPGEPSWESPWGAGRPGWHIECSVMSYTILGEEFDIHGGGKDLIFPHHENEIAQSEGAFNKPLARYWMHNGFVNINHEKMSKSLGNFVVISDILHSYHPDVLRLFLLSNHYRSPIDFTDQVLDDADAGLDRIYAFLERLEEFLEPKSLGEHGLNGKFWDQFCGAMDDDFNTARGIGVLFEAVRRFNRLMDEQEGYLSKELKQQLVIGRSDILRMGKILGILDQSPKEYFHLKKSSALINKSLDSTVIENLINERSVARKENKWERADRIREKLDAMNVILEDRPEGTVWKIVE